MFRILFILMLIILPRNAHAANTEISTAGTNISIGTTSVANALGVQSTLAVGSATYTSKSATANGMIVEGNVGIGSFNPTSNLDVIGTIKASTDVIVAGSSVCRANGTNCPSGGTNPWISTSGVGIGTTSNVGVGTYSPQGAFQVKQSNITYVGCSSSIDTAIINATAGDTLKLGSCTYTPSSGMTTITKAIKIQGQGKQKTIIDAGTNVIATLFPSTADGLKMSDLTITGTRLTNVISIDLQATTSTSGVDNVFSNISISAKNTNATTNGISLFDTGAVVLNSEIVVGGADWGAGGQSYGIVNDMHSTTDADEYLYVKNTRVENISTDTVGDITSIIRGIRFYNFLNGDDPFNMYLTIDNTVVKVRDDATPHNSIEALHMQGAREHNYIFNTSLDGYGSSTTNTQNKLKDFRCDDGAVCHFANTAMVGGFWQIQSGTVYRDGYLGGNGIILDQGNQDGPSPSGTQASALLSGTGALGGNSNGTSSSQTGGTGAPVILTGGVGGISTTAAVTNNGGLGGYITYTSGTGGNMGIGTTSVNIGGIGGVVTLAGGDGGAASGSTVSNTGGVGGPLYIYGGAAGVGIGTSAASGTNGPVYLGVRADGTSQGAVVIGSTAAANKPNKFNVVGTSFFNGNVGIGTFDSTFLLTVSSAPGTSSSTSQRLFNLNGHEWQFIATGSAGATMQNGFIIRDNSAGANRIFIDSGGNLGIGTNVVRNGISVIGNASIGAVANVGISGPTNGLYVQGNVGIATLTPSANLEVKGTFRTIGSSTSPWTVKSGANTACNTTCNLSQCAFGEDTGVIGTLLACSDATADVCVCMGP